jgi:hypothetical protein
VSLDAVADLEAAGRGVEGDHSGDQRGQRPRAKQPEQRPGRSLGEPLERDIGDTPERAGGGAEEQPDRAAVFEQKGEVGGHRRGEREDQSGDHDKRPADTPC